MKPYNPVLKPFSRNLRTNMTDAEQLLWSKLRRKQILGLQFYRQKPIANYIVDFYCAAANLVIELDGSQHFEPDHQASDAERDRALESMGIKVLRFDNRQVLTETDAVMTVIFSAVKQIPPSPPFAKGGAGNSSELNLTEQEEPISPFFAHCEESSISPFEKTECSATTFEKVEESISPPFAKGGLGGFSKKGTT